MRQFLPVCVLLPGFLALLPGAGIKNESPSTVTVILDFKGPWSRVSIKEMQRESGSILKSSGVRLGWEFLGEHPTATYNDLVVMTFKGPCEFEPASPRYDELGPYALTRTSDGEVLPFGEVDCHRVLQSVLDAISGGDFDRGDQLLGRALGRVVAHELVHMLTKSETHGSDGVEKAALSGKQLVAPVLPLSAFDVGRLKRQLDSH